MRKSDAGWVALALINHLGGKKLLALNNLFDGNLQAILSADQASLRHVHGIGPKIAASIGEIQGAPLDRLKRQMELWHGADIHYAIIGESEYPAHMMSLPDPPAILFWRGIEDAIPSVNTPSIAIVGTRSPTPKVTEATERIAYELACAGVIVVSGLALGIDTAAHRGALAAGGRTLAVLGGGILNIYPPENQALAEQLIRCGALTSEVSPVASARTPALVARNRLITAFSSRLLVAETTADGGAMHAAKRAIAGNIPLFTFDLPATGNQSLIQQGAQCLPLDSLFPV